MNTPKTFEPVVPMPEPVAFLQPVTLNSSDPDHFLSAKSLWPNSYDDWFPVYTAAQLRAYAAEVARQMVGCELAAFVPLGPLASESAEKYAAHNAYNTGIVEGINSCRAATLSSIDEWEKNDE